MRAKKKKRRGDRVASIPVERLGLGPLVKLPVSKKRLEENQRDPSPQKKGSGN